ncbi:receptor-type tyrosine-protein phosphatase H isoform 1-T1 [Megaptera novaeangliae]
MLSILPSSTSTCVFGCPSDDPRGHTASQGASWLKTWPTSSGNTRRTAAVVLLRSTRQLALEDHSQSQTVASAPENSAKNPYRNVLPWSLEPPGVPCSPGPPSPHCGRLLAPGVGAAEPHTSHADQLRGDCPVRPFVHLRGEADLKDLGREESSRLG